MDNQSRVFASVLPPPAREVVKMDTNGHPGPSPSPSPSPRELRVKGVAELSSPADRASVTVWVSSGKESLNEAFNSVTRRTDYILQCVRQFGVRPEDTLIHRRIHRDENMYHVNTEVTVIFSDFAKMDLVCRVLLEKLDKSVIVGLPHYYHSPECLSQLRRRVCAAAVENAHQKASDISRLLGQALGSPLQVVEEETKDLQTPDRETPTFPRVPHLKPVGVYSRVSVSFGLKDGVQMKV